MPRNRKPRIRAMCVEAHRVEIKRIHRSTDIELVFCQYHDGAPARRVVVTLPVDQVVYTVHELAKKLDDTLREVGSARNLLKIPTNEGRSGS